ncbi:hypothetical protein ACOSQ4_012380 [Xanthoceras sorbifolium]
MLGGLGHEFDPVVILLSSQRDTVTMQEAQYLLILHEHRIEQLNTSKQIDVSCLSANYASSGNGDKNIYKNDGSNNRGGQPRGRGKGRSTGRWNQNQKLVCQVCSRTGNMALQCYRRFDQSIQYQGHQNSSQQGNTTNQQQNGNANFNSNYQKPANFQAQYATPETVADPSWYVDSGATNLVTADMYNLTLSNEYKGNAHLIVGNGEKLPIMHIGNSVVKSTSSSTPIYLNQILHVPKVTKNLLSRLTKDNGTIADFLVMLVSLRTRVRIGFYFKELLEMGYISCHCQSTLRIALLGLFPLQLLLLLNVIKLLVMVLKISFVVRVKMLLLFLRSLMYIMLLIEPC